MPNVDCCDRCFAYTHGDQRKVLTFLLLPLDGPTTYVVETTTCVVFLKIGSNGLYEYQTTSC